MTSLEPPPGTPPQAPRRPSPEARFGGWLLIVIGGLLVLLCGGCTLTLWGVGLVGLKQDASAAAWGSIMGLFVTTLLIGGVPTAGGAILVWAGFRVLRPIKAPKAVAKTFE
jgi:hypothetical protein